MNPRVRCLVVDLDGVLRHFERVIDPEMQAVLSAVAFGEPLLGQVTRGRISDDEWRAQVRASLAPALGFDVASQAVRSWSESPGTLNKDVMNLVREARSRVPVVLLTNATSRLREDLATLGALDEFDAIVSSAETGFAKPEPEAYAAVESAAQGLVGQRLESGEHLFVDDVSANIDGAYLRGWQAERFSSVEGMRQLLRRHHLVE